MRFVDGEEGEPPAFPQVIQQRQEAVGQQALGRHVDQVEFVRAQAAFGFSGGSKVLR
jgi:hypothetical protein